LAYFETPFSPMRVPTSSSRSVLVVHRITDVSGSLTPSSASSYRPRPLHGRGRYLQLSAAVPKRQNPRSWSLRGFWRS
jgi:hypothetical protein